MRRVDDHNTISQGVLQRFRPNEEKGLEGFWLDRTELSALWSQRSHHSPAKVLVHFQYLGRKGASLTNLEQFLRCCGPLNEAPFKRGLVWTLQERRAQESAEAKTGLLVPLGRYTYLARLTIAIEKVFAALREYLSGNEPRSNARWDTIR